MPALGFQRLLMGIPGEFATGIFALKNTFPAVFNNLAHSESN
jgi:hypothetical protein